MGVKCVASFSSLKLSPASYQPECLSEYAKLASSQDRSACFTALLCQLNSFDSWIITPAYHDCCMVHLAASNKMNEFVKFAQNRVMAGDIEAAIVALELGKKDSWPEIYRLHRRHVDSFYVLNVKIVGKVAQQHKSVLVFALLKACCRPW